MKTENSLSAEEIGQINRVFLKVDDFSESSKDV